MANFNNPTELRYLMTDFISRVQDEVRRTLEKAEAGGRSAGFASLSLRKINTSIQPVYTDTVTPAVDAVTEVANQQASQTVAIALVGGNVEQVVGDGVNSVGFLSQGTLNRLLAGYITALLLSRYEETLEAFIQEQIDDNTYYKQAVAAIDENTTECCLIVHGQFQPMDKPFILTGSPRFADEIEQPPFHWNCRTALALVHASERYDGLTQEMLLAAADEMKARGETGYRVEIHPAHATSRR